MAAHAKPNHDYHLVNPSPWPFVGSVSAFIMAIGAILWFHEIVPPWILIVGFVGVLVVAILLRAMVALVLRRFFAGIAERAPTVEERRRIDTLSTSRIAILVARNRTMRFTKGPRGRGDPRGCGARRLRRAARRSG